MPNYNTQFSFAIANITPAEQAWITTFLGRAGQLSIEAGPDLSDAERQIPYIAAVADSGDLGFEWEFDDDGCWLHADEAGSPDLAADFVQAFLREHRPTSFVTFSWANTCSRPNLGEFGGGAMAITATTIDVCSAYAWMEDRSAAFLERQLTDASHVVAPAED